MNEAAVGTGNKRSGVAVEVDLFLQGEHIQGATDQSSILEKLCDHGR